MMESAATQERPLAEIVQVRERTKKGVERLKGLKARAPEMWWSGLAPDRNPMPTFECTRQGVFYGMEYPKNPFSRGLIPSIITMIRPREKTPTLPADPREPSPVEALLALSTTAVATSEVQAEVLAKGKEDERKQWIRVLRDLAERARDKKFGSLNIRLTPVRAVIEMFGRGRFVDTRVNALLDDVKKSLGQDITIGHAARHVATMLGKVWETRMSRDNEISHGTARSGWPVIVELSAQEAEALKIAGLSEEEYLAVKLIDNEMRILSEADVVFRALYYKRYGRDFNPDKIRADHNRAILSDFHAATQEEIDLILRDNFISSVFTKNSYYSFFKLDDDGEIAILNRERDLQINFECYGKRFLYSVLGARNSQIRRLSSFVDLANMVHQVVTSVSRERNADPANFDQARREISLAMTTVLYNPDLVSVKKGWQDVDLQRDLKPKLNPDSEGEIGKFIEDLRVWKQGDLTVSIGANDPAVFGDNPSNGEFDGALGRAKHLDMSRGANGQLIVSEKSVHQIQDAEHAADDLDFLLEEIIHDEQVLPTRAVIKEIKGAVLPSLNFGFAAKGSIFVEVPDYPREFFHQESMPGAMFKPAANLQAELREAVRGAMMDEVNKQIREILDLAVDIGHPENAWKKWPALKERLFSEVQKYWERQLMMAAIDETHVEWEKFPSEIKSTMTVEDQDAARKKILAEQVNKLRPEYQQQQKTHESRLLSAGIRESGEFSYIGGCDRAYAQAQTIWQLRQAGQDEKAAELEATKLPSVEFSLSRNEVAHMIISVISPEQGIIMERKPDGLRTYTVNVDQSNLWKLMEGRDQMNLLFLTPAGLNTAARITALAERGKPAAERIIVDAPGAERLHVSTVIGDQLSMAAAEECIRTLQGKNLGDDEDVRYIYSTYVQSLTAIAAFNVRGQICYAKNAVSNTDIISAGSGNAREGALRLISKATNPSINTLYYPRGMGSWLNRKPLKRKNGKIFVSRVKRFPTVLTDGIEDSEGVVDLQDVMNMYFRSDSRLFIEKTEDEMRVDFKNASPAQRAQLVETARGHFLEARKQEMMIKLFTFAVGLTTQNEFNSAVSDWKANRQNLQAEHKNSFLNYLVYCYCCNNKIEFPLNDEEITEYAKTVAEEMGTGGGIAKPKVSLSDPDYAYIRVYVALQKYNFAELQM